MSLASDNAKPTRAGGDTPRFQWDDALLLDDALSEDERMVRDMARAYSQEKLLPRIIEANRN
ncbi:MAG: acyl-CoA dehydrogenase, partial [Proteobacteria bacterium]|nr:acyl-CoA dehydrogenase [Pseudomonadota bacterium]